MERAVVNHVFVYYVMALILKGWNGERGNEGTGNGESLKWENF